MQSYRLNVELRTEKGKNECYRLRQAGYVPAILNSHGISEVIKFQKKDFSNLFRGHISESVLIDINITNKAEDAEHKVFVKDYQQDPITDELLHIDFFKIKMDEKIQTFVDIETIGVSPGVKMGGIMEVLERQVEVECLPSDMPEKIQVDISELQIGDSVHIRELPMSDTLNFLGNSDSMVVSIKAPHVVEAAEEGVEAAEEEVEAKEGAEVVDEGVKEDKELKSEDK